MKTVYIETTIPSYYFESRRSPMIVAWRAHTRLWWERHRRHYALVTSEFVLAELTGAPPLKAAAATSLLAGVRVLPDHPRLVEVATRYMSEHVMPSGAGGDAYHLAMASLHHVDFLLTWNCKHLANANKVRHIEAVNRRLGLPTPLLTTPVELVPEELP